MARLLLNMENAQDWYRVFDTFSDGLYITNAEGLTLKVNTAYEEMTGICKEQVVGRYMDDIVNSGILSNSITKKVMKAKNEIKEEQVASNGAHLFLHGIPIYDDDDILMVLTIVRDVSQINRLEKQLNESKALIEYYQSQFDEMEGTTNFVADSVKFKSVVTLIRKVAQVDSTVLIYGESGTGKEVLAKELHEKSQRKSQPFLKVNCGAIPENLLEAELFGYESGAFTGARKGGHIGLFEAASNGILFLDEIGDMPFHLQVKLLRVLQENTVMRIGSNKEIPVNTRVVAATNRDLKQMVKDKTFREDLYYRLNVVDVKIPALRERKEDIPGLVNFFLQKLNKKYNFSKKLSSEVMGKLFDYDWPGNVRELENVIERMVVTSSAEVITADDACFGWRNPEQSTNLYTHWQEIISEEPISLKEALKKVESQIISDAAKKYHTTYEIAKALQISQPTASRKLKQYGIIQ